MMMMMTMWMMMMMTGQNAKYQHNINVDYTAL